MSSLFIQISLKFVPRGPIDNKSFQVRTWSWCLVVPEPMLSKISKPKWYHNARISYKYFSCDTEVWSDIADGMHNDGDCDTVNATTAKPLV